jgi:hypothetical protein
LPGSEDASAANSSAAVHAASEAPDVKPRSATEFSTVIQNRVWPMLARASQNGNPDVPGVVSTLATTLQSTATGHAPPDTGG